MNFNIFQQSYTPLNCTLIYYIQYYHAFLWWYTNHLYIYIFPVCGLPRSHGRTSLTCQGERRPSAPWPWSSLSITTNPHPSMSWMRLMLPWISKMSPLLLITLRYGLFRWKAWFKNSFFSFPCISNRIKCSHDLKFYAN